MDQLIKLKQPATTAVEQPEKKQKHQKAPKDIAVSLSERPTLTLDEFCAMVGIGRSTCYKAIKAGDLRLSKYGKRSFIKREDMLRFVQNMGRAAI